MSHDSYPARIRREVCVDDESSRELGQGQFTLLHGRCRIFERSGNVAGFKVGELVENRISADTRRELPGLGSSPAFSVGEGNAGEIHAKINRPKDAAGLEQALAEQGITADITYLPELQTCAPDRYKVVDRRLPGMMASIGERNIAVTLPPDTVRAGETFVLTWSVLPMTAEAMAAIPGSKTGDVVGGFTASVEFDIATGPVAPGEPVDATTD